MDKSIIIEHFGGVLKTADELRVTRQSVWKWPDKLTYKQHAQVLGLMILAGKPIPKSWKEI